MHGWQQSSSRRHVHGLQLQFASTTSDSAFAHEPRLTCVLECPKGSICQPTRGMAPNVRFRKLRSGAKGDRSHLPSMHMQQPSQVTRAKQDIKWPWSPHRRHRAPVPARGLVNHAHIVRRRLVVLHVPAVGKVQLQAGQRPPW